MEEERPAAPEFDTNLLSTLQSLKGTSANNRLMTRLNNLVALGTQGSAHGAKIRKPSDYNASEFFAKLRKLKGI